MRLIEVADGATVADNKVLETPLVTQNGLQQTLTATARVIVETLVGTHHLAHLGILHQGLESRHISFPHIAGRHISQIGRMACVFGTAMDGIVLGAGPQLTILGIFRALQASYNLCAHHAGQIRVFTIGFLSPAPSRVAKDVDIRCPHGQAMELLVLATVQHAVIVLGTELGAGSIEHII